MPFDFGQWWQGLDPKARGALTGGAIGAGGLGLFGYLSSPAGRKRKGFLTGAMLGGLGGAGAGAAHQWLKDPVESKPLPDMEEGVAGEGKGPGVSANYAGAGKGKGKGLPGASKGGAGAASAGAGKELGAVNSSPGYGKGFSKPTPPKPKGANVLGMVGGGAGGAAAGLGAGLGLEKGIQGVSKYRGRITNPKWMGNYAKTMPSYIDPAVNPAEAVKAKFVDTASRNEPLLEKSLRGGYSSPDPRSLTVDQRLLHALEQGEPSFKSPGPFGTSVNNASQTGGADASKMLRKILDPAGPSETLSPLSSQEIGDVYQKWDKVKGLNISPEMKLERLRSSLRGPKGVMGRVYSPQDISGLKNSLLEAVSEAGHRPNVSISPDEIKAMLQRGGYTGKVRGLPGGAYTGRLGLPGLGGALGAYLGYQYLNR